LEEAITITNDLFKKFTDHKVKFNDSIRTSTHVHLNFYDKTFKQVINFFTLFSLLEEVLQFYSGEDRKGNLFCVSTREASGLINDLSSSVAQGNFTAFARDRYKYAACNLSTLYKFGTIEVRTMRGATSAEQVINWLNILNDMYGYSLKMRSPADLIISLSHLGAENLMREIFSHKSYSELMKSFPVPRTLHYSLMEGVRVIQVFAFEYDEMFKVDPPAVQKAAKRVGQGPLPPRIMEGPFGGTLYQVWRPDGIGWNVSNHHGGHWLHGERCVDCPQIWWHADQHRFMWEGRDGIPIPLNWKRHHVIPDEGRLVAVLVEPEEEIEDEEDIDWAEHDWDDD
jgi:hypothetical protein